jgi:cytosine/adenosine deaminase-related metal-dependent hydrolase
MSTDNVTPINGEGTPADEHVTVVEVRRALHERHGRALADVDRRLAALSADRVRRDAVDELVEHAERIAGLKGDLLAGYGRFITSDDDPLAALGREVRELVDLYAVVELLAGRGARRGQAGQSS